MLIDGHSMAFRAFYALPVDKFATSGGQSTNVVYGFLSMLATLINDEQPTHLAVAFDVGRTTFRSKLFPEYKAQREAAPPEFKGQIPLLKKVLAALKVTTIEMPDYEADDIIATLATRAKPEGFETLIVTGDRDSFQLVNEQTTVLYPMRGVSTIQRFTPGAIVERYQLTPAQYPDFAALRGDPSDNLPSIPKVGEKTALKWIIQYQNLENLLQHADEIGGKVGENLRERVEQVRMNRTLTEMVKDLDLDLSLDALELEPASATAVAAEFDDLEFGTALRNRVLQAFEANDDEIESAAEVASLETFTGSFQSFLKQHVGTKPAAVSLDGDPTPALGNCAALAISVESGDGHIGFGCQPSELDARDYQALADWLESDSPKIVHGAKAAFHMLQGEGITLGGVYGDTEIAAYLLRPGQRTYELPEVYQRHLNRSLPVDQSSGQLSLLERVETTALLRQASAVLELAKVLNTSLTEIASFELYQDLELPLVGILAQMEHIGIAVDREVLEQQLEVFEQIVRDHEQQARDIVDSPTLNLSSPKQLQSVLFETLGLPKTKKTKTGYSTAAKEIEALAISHPHPFLDHLLGHRENQKLKTTLEGLIKAIGDDGRIHTSFKQTVTSTGRLSSADPNLQNIPVRTPAGRKIRSAFVVGDDYEALLTADYSQIEMRVMAHLSNDEGLIEAYSKGEDLHNYVGSKVFNVPVDEVTPELRRRVKAMSYGLVYGLSSFGLSQQLRIPNSEAKEIMENYFERFGGVKRYLDEVVDQARKDGYTSTLFGRRRYLPELSSDNRVARENAERAALNAPIQGTAADIIKVAMVRVDRRIATEQLRSRVLLQVHDELVVEVASGEMERISRIVHEEMDQAIRLRVPLEVSAGTGANWEMAAH